MDTNTDRWRVQLSSGGSRAMTLDELDEAFQRGEIDEATPVLAPGATTWARLADVAGLEGEPVEPSPSLAPVAVSTPTPPHEAAPVKLEAAAPVLDVADLSDDAFRTSRKRRVAVVAGITAVVLGLGALGAMKLGAAASSVGPSPLLKGYANAPQAAEDLPAPAVAPNALTEEQRKKLHEADRAREAARKAKQPAAAPNRSSRQKSAPFVNSGNKYDPLNGSL